MGIWKIKWARERQVIYGFVGVIADLIVLDTYACYKVVERVVGPVYRFC